MAGEERRPVLLIAPPDGVTAAMVEALAESPAVSRVEVVAPGAPDLGARAMRAVVVLRPPADRRRGGPDLEAAGAALAACAGAARVVLLSSAEAVEPRHDHPGLIEEARWTPPRANAVSRRWLELERLARRLLAAGAAGLRGGDSGSAGGSGVPLLVLRPAPLASPEAPELHVRLLAGRLCAASAGFDPSIQLLAVEDLAAAVCRAVEAGGEGTFFVAPAGTVPLSAAIRLAGAHRLPVPHEVRHLLRRARATLGSAGEVDELAWTRHPATVSGEDIARALGFVPRHTSAEAVAAAFGRAKGRGGEPVPTFDDFGLDRGYVAAYGRTLFRFLHRLYWRVETRGLEHVPREGGAVLVGVHRGFMPWDGVMALQTLTQGINRVPRFLIHPALVKFPFLANYMIKLGGVVACQENAGRLLGRGELLGVFPEGIHGAFTMYRDAYRLGRAWRDDCVRMAIRNGVPIVPFVTVGSAEIYPILGRIEWRWWRRVSEWPYLPLCPNFPLPGLPLPSKWHTLFLPPIPVHERHPREAAEDPEVVREAGREVRRRVEEALAWMLARRHSIFRGSIFAGDEAQAATGQAENAVDRAGPGDDLRSTRASSWPRP